MSEEVAKLYRELITHKPPEKKQPNKIACPHCGSTKGLKRCNDGDMSGAECIDCGGPD